MTITAQVDLLGATSRRLRFERINPYCTVPVPVLDDGATITDAIANCRCLEELHPDPLSMETERAVSELGSAKSSETAFVCHGGVPQFRTRTERRCVARPDAFEQILVRQSAAANASAVPLLGHGDLVGHNLTDDE